MVTPRSLRRCGRESCPCAGWSGLLLQTAAETEGTSLSCGAGWILAWLFSGRECGRPWFPRQACQWHRGRRKTTSRTCAAHNLNFRLQLKTFFMSRLKTQHPCEETKYLRGDVVLVELFFITEFHELHVILETPPEEILLHRLVTHLANMLRIWFSRLNICNKL